MAAVLDRPTSNVGVTLDEFLTSDVYGDGDELMFGMVWPEMPEGPTHSLRTEALRNLFAARSDGRWVGHEVALQIVGASQPRPDVVVFRETFETYLRRDAFDARDAEAVIEVSLSTHDRDYGPKDLLYAQAGIPEYVIVDLKNRAVEVRTEPSARGYLRRAPLGPGDVYRGVSFEDLLGPVGT